MKRKGAITRNDFRRAAEAIGPTEAERAVLREAFSSWQGVRAAVEDRHGAGRVVQRREALRALESGKENRDRRLTRPALFPKRAPDMWLPHCSAAPFVLI
ncbi:MULTISPECIES: hypothetical protein [unclassified Sphingomonas]|uniref:hypothetical protein n=1 Tax=unclassified Sphingomonas TaxID=196159 RepID=UPI000AA2A355|nr:MULTISPECIES: hypothetical protein [unclassified Sphingomonas]